MSDVDTITAEQVIALATAYGIETGHEIIRHECGAWTVLLRFGGPQVRYFTAGSHFINSAGVVDGRGYILLQELGLDTIFNIWSHSRSEFERHLSFVQSFVEKRDDAQ
jgi:hypothetical protein